MKASPDFLIVVGASAGGLAALRKLVKDFEPGLNAAVCVVLHLPDISDTNFFVQQLRMNSTLICMEATHNLQIRKDHIYVAPVNKHLLVNDGKLILGNGARENRWRPSIDVLFRSAAAHYSTRSIGVILTGLLNDGVAGMSAIKRSKGKCIVLDPKEAEYPEMPEAVLANVKTDYTIPLAEIVPVIKKLTQKKIKQQKAPADVIAESRIAEKAVIGIERVEPLGENTVYSCPDCGGNLWEIKDNGMNRYRCHTGHTYSENDLVLSQREELESTLWTALRMMEERKHLLTTIHDQNLKRGLRRLAALNNDQADEIATHIDRLKAILFSGQNK